MTVHLNANNFGYFAFATSSPLLSERDQNTALALSVLMGICTLGIGHLISSVVYAVQKPDMTQLLLKIDDEYKKIHKDKKDSDNEFTPARSSLSAKPPVSSQLTKEGAAADQEIKESNVTLELKKLEQAADASPAETTELPQKQDVEQKALPTSPIEINLPEKLKALSTCPGFNSPIFKLLPQYMIDALGGLEKFQSLPELDIGNYVADYLRIGSHRITHPVMWGVDKWERPFIAIKVSVCADDGQILGHENFTLFPRYSDRSDYFMVTSSNEDIYNPFFSSGGVEKENFENIEQLLRDEVIHHPIRHGRQSNYVFRLYDPKKVD